MEVDVEKIDSGCRKSQRERIQVVLLDCFLSGQPNVKFKSTSTLNRLSSLFTSKTTSRSRVSDSNSFSSLLQAKMRASSRRNNHPPIPPQPFQPLADTATFRDLLIFEERLKQNAARMGKRKSKYQSESYYSRFDN